MSDRRTDFGETVIDVPALIAEARAFIEGSDSARSALIRDLADELEKAHTPTENEQEAPKQEICERCGWAISAHARSQYGLDCPLGRVRPGFRRSESQGEPSDAQGGRDA